MYLIKPSFEILSEFNRIKILKEIEESGRTCYKSDSKYTEETGSNFLKSIVSRGHLSVIEHTSISLKFICNRGFSHELVRHRLAAYSQECLTGDTIIKTGSKLIKIKDLFDRKSTCYGKTHNKTMFVKSVNNDGIIINNKMIDVFFSGKKDVYEVISEKGYKIKCTMNHKFLTDDNYKCLNDLSVGDIIYVNGRKSLLKISDKELSSLYLNEKKSPLAISYILNVPYRTIIRRLKELNIFKKRLNTNGVGEKNSNYKNGIGFYRKLKENISYCELCNTTKGKLEVHHIDENRKNNKENNLIKVCINCHKVFHPGWYVGEKILKDKIKQITYIGEEDTYDIEMKSPYNNYIANGFIVHNSTRYCAYNRKGMTFIIPPWFINVEEGQYNSNCESKNFSLTEAFWFASLLHSEEMYNKLIELGQKPEQARDVLPNALKTEVIMTANLREWLHVFELRCSEKAHPQMRELMIPLREEIKKVLPELFTNNI